MHQKHPLHQTHKIHRKTKETDISVQICAEMATNNETMIDAATNTVTNAATNAMTNAATNTETNAATNAATNTATNAATNAATDTTSAPAMKTLIDTGVAFYDHMLTLFAFRAGLALQIHAKGDLAVDTHHTIEDVGITLGLAVADLLGDKTGIARYGSARIPMDESLAQVDIDLSGRPYLVCNADIRDEMLEEFFRAFTNKAGITLHINLLYGKNEHHKCEAIYKAFGAAFKQAITRTDTGVPSTKGVL